jgi:hypothetical protein
MQFDLLFPERILSGNVYSAWLGHKKNTQKRLINGQVRWPGTERAADYMNHAQYKEKWHWMVKEAWCRAMKMQGMGLPESTPTMKGRVAIQPIIGYAQGETQLDPDNLWEGLKPVIDFMTMPKGRKRVGLGIFTDDSGLYLKQEQPIPAIVKGDLKKAMILNISQIEDYDNEAWDHDEFCTIWKEAGGIIG